MDFTTLITLIIVGFVVLLTLAIVTMRSRSQGNSRSKDKDSKTILKEANKRLSQNPKDPIGLLQLADIHYRANEWDKARKNYAILMDLCATNSDLNEFEVTLRHALCSMQLKDYDEAYKGLVIARTFQQDVFEVNYNLGFLEFRRKNYEKAMPLLKQALVVHQDHPQSKRYLGHTLFKLKKFKEALALLKRTVDVEPDDKESVFAMGQCYYELGLNDQAVRIFSHLRPDPVMGPSAALLAGTINLKTRQYEKAILDFEIGLRHQNIVPEIRLELLYRLAAAYTKDQEIGKALPLLQQIHDAAPGYKDVSDQISKYRELNSNKHLQTFLISPTSDFVTLCRKVVYSFFPRSKVKITDITVEQSDYADILADVETSKWEDTIMFRFIRTTGTVGELALRDFNTRIKDLKAGRGFCICAGNYSETAVKFVEARLIDLIGKEKLNSTLQKIDSVMA